MGYPCFSKGLPIPIITHVKRVPAALTLFHVCDKWGPTGACSNGASELLLSLPGQMLQTFTQLCHLLRNAVICRDLASCFDSDFFFFLMSDRRMAIQNPFWYYFACVVFRYLPKESGS